MPKPDTNLISTKEAAALLSEGVRQVIRRVERDELTPAMKLPGVRGAYLFNHSDIEALVTTENTAAA